MRGLATIVASGVAVASLGLAAAATAVTPMEQTRKTLEQTRVIVDSPVSHNQKLSELSALLKTFPDTDAMGKAALDKNWAKFAPAQQKEFLSLFRELFQRTYVQKLLLFERPDFAYVKEEVDGSTARVDTKILTPRDDFAVLYRMRADGNRWLVTDIKIEDLSLTDNFRRQLDRLLAKSSVDEVLDRMRRKYGVDGKSGEDDGL